MGKINVFARWNLNEQKWIKNPDKKDYGQSFAIATYDRIINDNDKINYIIIDQGSRVEDHSKDFISIKEREVRIDNVIKHYKQRNENYDIQLLFLDKDAPIIEDAKLFAKYIEKIASLPTTASINIIGLSKCSVMNFYVPSFFTNYKTFYITNIYNIAAPYTGTKLASPLIFYPEVKKLITHKIPNSQLANLVYENLIKFYEGISSNSHMDYDIAMPNGIPENKLNVYDELFVKNVFSNNNIDSIKRLNNFKNIITGIDKNTLKESLRTLNFLGIGLCILDDLFFENKSDGMVYTESQKSVENFLDIQSYRLISTHHDVNSNLRAFNEVLSIVDDILENDNEKRINLKKKF